MPKNKILFIIFVLLALNCRAQQPQRVCLKDRCFLAELALTGEKRNLGLMLRQHLNADEGMLFVYNEEAYPGIWMKNMLISLDIIWINKDKEVVYIFKNASPCGVGSCSTMKPVKAAKYVLELNSGTADEIGLAVGDKAEFNLD